MQTQTQQLQGLLDPKELVSVISQAVTTNLKLGLQPNAEGGVDAKGSGFVGKPYPRKTQTITTGTQH